MRPSPHLPAGVTARPFGFQNHLVADRIHALPVPAMPECSKLPLAGQPLERRRLESGGIVFDIVHHLGLENEKASVDPSTVTGWLLLEMGDRRFVMAECDCAEAARRLDGREGRDATLLAVESHEARDVDVADAVAVGAAEALVADVLSDTLQPPSGHDRFASVDQ